MTETAEPLIRKTPDVAGGEACIRQTRIGVWNLVGYRKLGMSDAELLDAYPSLTSADLDAAWDYYRSNPVEIERALWVNDTAGNVPTGTPPPAWVLVSGLLLGLPVEVIRDAFDPPLTLTKILPAELLRN